MTLLLMWKDLPYNWNVDDDYVDKNILFVSLKSN